MVFIKKNKKDEEEGGSKKKGVDSSVKSDDSSYGPDGSSEGNKTGSASSGVMGTSESSSSLTLTKKESRDVFRLRVIVTAFLVLTAVAVCTVVYKVTKNGEVNQFDAQFDGNAQKITESFEAIIVKMSAISGLGVAMSAESVDSGTSWPFLTLSNFQERAMNALQLSGAIFVNFAPVVREDQWDAWNKFVTDTDNNQWILDAYNYQERKGTMGFEDLLTINRTSLTTNFVDPMHYFIEDGASIPEDGPGPYLPIWQTAPVLQLKVVNENLLRRVNVSEEAWKALDSESALLGNFINAPEGKFDDINPYTALFSTLLSIDQKKAVDYLGDPLSYLYTPVYDFFKAGDRSVVALMTCTLYWRKYLMGILPDNVNGLIAVLENSCGGRYTYYLEGKEAFPVGYGDLHDPQYDSWKRSGFFIADTLQDGTVTGVPFYQDSCFYSVHVYPSQEYADVYLTNMPAVITCAIAAAFLITTALFIFYDRLVEHRQKIIFTRAMKATAVVSSLFPKAVRDKLLNEGKGAQELTMGTKGRLKGFMNGEEASNDINESCMADLFANCTVMFADISGFTAWSSTREPPQVFMLLQSLYGSFDVLAKRRKVFKVETIGDSYMAVTGVPEPQKKHAIIMVRFAWECLMKMQEVTKELESTLGPDTGDLTMRVGIHSGPVTAGVLKGERARFQLFGDTVNTASRMESTGARQKVQISSSTGKLLIAAGKEHWLKPREDTVFAKGKGVLNTYWANPTSKRGSSVASDAHSQTSSTGQDSGQNGLHALSINESVLVNNRYVDWMVDLLMDDIRKVVHGKRSCDIADNTTIDLFFQAKKGVTCLDEMKDCIPMPILNATAANTMSAAKDIHVEQSLLDSMRELVNAIAMRYNDNPFHNFEHACHVTMSCIKLLKRIVAPEMNQQQTDDINVDGLDAMVQHLHESTYGINSDPLTAFAITFSALIHDVDHRGVSNMQLVVEAPEMATKYRNKCIAEQNSLDVAWDILMEERFDLLRRYLFQSQEDLERFRQLIVNVVLATDIFDKELNEQRKARWEKAFTVTGERSFNMDLRATIIIEHIIQASDVSHTMQHWHVYAKWNKRLFMEMFQAFEQGRLAKSPECFWYKGEIGFFDNYIIPLAKKLADCGIFGVSSDEYLTYAIQNRNEWEERGENMVKSYLEEITTMKAKKAAKEAKRLKMAAGEDEEEPVKFDDVELEKEV